MKRSAYSADQYRNHEILATTMSLLDGVQVATMDLALLSCHCDENQTPPASLAQSTM